jgi:arylsulfatase A-like enzyme
MTASPRSRALRLPLLALLQCCSLGDRPEEPRSADAADPAACTRLLPGPLSAGIPWEIVSAWHRAPLPSSRPESGLEPRLHSTFEGAVAGADSLEASGWLSHPSFGERLGGGAAPFVAPSVRDGHLELAGRRSVAVRIVPAASLTPWVLSLRVRAPAGTSRETRLLLMDLTEDPSSLRDPVALAQRILEPGVVSAQSLVTRDDGDAHNRRLEVGAPDGDGFEPWRLEFTTGWNVRALLLVALGSEQGPQPVAIDDVTLHELPARSLVGLPNGPLLTSAFDLPRPWENLDAKLRATKVRCDWESRRALLLPRGAVARCSPPRPQGDGMLEFGFGIVREDRLTRDGDHAEHVRVTVDGQTVRMNLSLRANSPSGWSELGVPIAGTGTGAGDRIEVRLEVEGDDTADGPLVAIGDPLLFSHPPDAETRATAGPNLVVISLDTMRADRLGRTHAGRSLTRNLDRLAAQSVVCRTALANSSYTLPSHVSMFTSQRPGEHGVLTVFDSFSPQRSANLAGIAARHGYVTAAFTSGGMLNAEFCGIDLGFDRFGEIDAMLAPDDRLRRAAPLRERGTYNREIAAKNRLDRAVLPWLAGHRGVPFVLLVHTYLLHNYQPEPAFREEFTRGLPATPFRLTGPVPYVKFLNDAWLKEHPDERIEFVGDGEHRFTPKRDLPWVEALYDATVAQADRDVGTILASLDQLGLASNTIVVVTSDHGEEMLEHDDLGHARTLFDEILHVPLLMRIPGVAPRAIDEPIESIDLAPTLLARMGLPLDPRMRGADLLAPGFEPRDVTIHEGVELQNARDTEGRPKQLRAARARGGKLVLVTPMHVQHDAGFLDADHVAEQLAKLGYIGGGTVAGGFFDLQSDPAEKVDLSASDALKPQQASQMNELARRLLEAPLPGAEPVR